jgi:DNA-binding NarL/FixJ family response regulator
MSRPARQLNDDEKLRVLVVDDHDLFRICLRKTLEAEGTIEVAAEMSSGEGIIENVARHAPHLILLDLDMPVVDGLAALQILAEHSVACPVVVLTAVEDRASLTRAVELGARGIVLKRFAIEDLMQAIREVRLGGRWLSRAVPEMRQPADSEADESLQAVLASSPSLRRIERWTAPSWSRLTPREREIAGLVAQGIRYSAVARKLGISEQTVKNHVRHVFDKLEVTNRLQLALFVANRKPA